MTSLSPPPSPGAPPFTGRLGSIASSCIRSTQLPAHSILLSWYTSFLACASIYSVVATPLLIVFPLARYDGHAAVEACLDAAFTLGVIIKLRTTYVSRDGTSHSAAFSACQYLKGQFTVDALGALPFEPIASAIFSSADREGLLWLHLLRAFRGLYILRRLRSLRGANVVRVVSVEAGMKERQNTSPLPAALNSARAHGELGGSFRGMSVGEHPIVGGSPTIGGSGSASSEALLKELLKKLDARAEWEAVTTQTLTSLIMQVNEVAQVMSAASRSQSRWL